MTEGMIDGGKFEPGRYPLSPIPIPTEWDISLHPELHAAAYKSDFMSARTIAIPVPEAIQRITGVIYRTTDQFKAKDINFDPERWYPITVNFDERLPLIGRAKVHHSTLDELTIEGELFSLAPVFPKLAAAILTSAVPGFGHLTGISVCRQNQDHSIPPYQLFPVEL